MCKEDEILEQEPMEAKPSRVTGMWETTAYVQRKERHEEIKGPDVFVTCTVSISEEAEERLAGAKLWPACVPWKGLTLTLRRSPLPLGSPMLCPAGGL